MEYAWLHFVAAQVSHRRGLSELARTDPQRTRQLLQHLSTADQAAFRKKLNGAHITQDGKHYCQECESDQCLYCSSSDSRFHRFWLCEAFVDCRAQVSDELWQAIPLLPESFTCYGWALRPTTYEEWFAALGEIQLLPIPAIPDALVWMSSHFHRW